MPVREGQVQYRGGGKPKTTEPPKTCLQGLPNKKQLENGRRTKNTSKARGRQAGKTHKENQSRSAPRTQQSRQAERARETGAGLLKERSGATTQKRGQNKA
eukprot:1138591-Pelagomonas_calceolata.AAC.1